MELKTHETGEFDDLFGGEIEVALGVAGVSLHEGEELGGQLSERVGSARGDAGVKEDVKTVFGDNLGVSLLKDFHDIGGAGAFHKSVVDIDIDDDAGANHEAFLGIDAGDIGGMEAKNHRRFVEDVHEGDALGESEGNAGFEGEIDGGIWYLGDFLRSDKLVEIFEGNLAGGHLGGEAFSAPRRWG